MRKIFMKGTYSLLAAAFLFLISSAAKAQTVALFSLPSGPNPVTALYPVGTADPNYTDIQFLYGPFTVADGYNNNATFTATQTAQAGQDGKSFETFTNDGSLDFPSAPS